MSVDGSSGQPDDGEEHPDRSLEDRHVAEPADYRA